MTRRGGGDAAGLKMMDALTLPSRLNKRTMAARIPTSDSCLIAAAPASVS